MTDNDELHWELLARAIAASQAGSTQAEIQQRGGPSPVALRQLRAGTYRSKNPTKILAQLDAGLEWVPGSARGALYYGEQPTPRSDVMPWVEEDEPEGDYTDPEILSLIAKRWADLRRTAETLRIENEALKAALEHHNPLFPEIEADLDKTSPSEDARHLKRAARRPGPKPQ